MLEINETRESFVFIRPILTPPSGLDEIVATFGNPADYVRSDGTLDPQWQADFLTTVTSPFPMLLSWDHSRYMNHFLCHTRLAEIFSSAFANIQAEGLHATVASFGGCFAFRQQRTGARLSAHSWGIAIDLNPETNPQGSKGNMDSRLVALFRSAGFTWGGDWEGKRKDPMHFQFCTGY